MGKPRIILDHQYIKKEYIDSHKKVNEIADNLGVSSSVIFRHLRECGVKTRKRGYGFNVAKEKILTQQQFEFFDGLMLSDGSICRRKTTNGRVSRGNDFLSCAFKHKEFAEYIKKQLNLKPKVHKKIHHSNRYKSGKCEQYGILSSANIFFTKERDRWYPDGIKIIPNNCRLTPVSLNIMYLGDGYICKNKHNNNINIATLSFTKQDIGLIIEYFKGIGIKATVNHINEIRISVYSSQDFLDYIGPCSVKCYKYKWDLNG